jgi:hypothetical protein
MEKGSEEGQGSRWSVKPMMLRRSLRQGSTFSDFSEICSFRSGLKILFAV